MPLDKSFQNGINPILLVNAQIPDMSGSYEQPSQDVKGGTPLFDLNTSASYYYKHFFTETQTKTKCGIICTIIT